MNKNIEKFLFIIIIIFVSSAPIRPQFIIENLNRPLNSIHFPNNKHGFIFAESIFYKTSNNGLNWSLPMISSAPLSDYLSGKFFFRDSLYGWGSNGGTKIIRTTNGGVSWNEYLVFYVFITDLYFVNRNTGWAIANENNSPYITVYKTTNSGVNWFGQTVTGYEKKPMLSIFMRNENTGWIGMDSGKVAYTTTGGNNWSIMNLNSSKKASLINFKNENCGWIWLNPGQILRTTDSGTNWSAYTMPYIYENTSSCYFIDSLNGWAVSGNHLLKTVNGGQNWTTINAGISGSLRNVCFSDQLTGWVVTSANQIIRTTNSGLNWSTMNNNTNDNFNSVYFNNIITGWVVSNNGAVYKSTNAGMNWEINFHHGSSNMSRILFQNVMTGWISGSGGYFFRTNNGGMNWNIINIAGLPSRSMCFSDVNKGWLAGDQGSIAMTNNSGINWSFLTPITTRNLQDIDFYGINSGIVCGDAGSVYMTSNAGTTWNEISVADTLSFTSVKYLSQDVIFLAGYCYYYVYVYPGVYVLHTNRKLYKSSNNGFSWQCLIEDNVSGNYPTAKISVSQASGGLSFVATDSYIRMTYDGGVSWSPNVSPYLSSLSYNSVFILDNMHSWAVGNNAAVVSSFRPAIGVTNIQTEMPSEYLLFQNYPNPFNPQTKIKFSIMSNRWVKISIFDLLGRQVSVLVDEFKERGVYDLVFNGSNLASGVYFCRIEAGDFVDSKKMVLLK